MKFIGHMWRFTVLHTHFFGINLVFQIEIKLKQTFQTIVPNNYGKNTMVTRALDFMQSEVGKQRERLVPVSVRNIGIKK